MILCMVLLFGTMSQAIANDGMPLEEVSATQAVKPIAYTHDFDGYGNVVGVLNSDGTKTAYLFSSLEQAEGVDSVTGLVSTQEEKLQRNSGAQSRGVNRPAIIDAPVYSKTEKSIMNYNTNPSMIIGNTSAYEIGRVYMKFDLSSLDSMGIAYTDILSACLYFTESTTIPAGTKSVIQAYLVSGEWEPSTVTWKTKPDYYGYEMIGCSNVGSVDEFFAQQTTNQLYITKAVMAWMQGLDNNGILLKEKDDEFDSRFYTTDWPITSQKPYVTVTYCGYSDESAYTIGQGIVNNTKYYIVNKETGKYLTATSTATGTAITQEDFSNMQETTQQWKFTEISSAASYKITLADTNKCLKNSSTALNNPVVLGTTATTTAQTWRLFRNWNGTYRFHSKVSSFGAVQANGTASAVIQDEYSCNFEHFDEWTLIAVSKGQANFYDFDIDINTTYGTETMTDVAEALAGYSSATRTTNSSVTNIDDVLQNSSLFYFSGHGKRGKLCFYTSEDVLQGDLIVCNNIREQTTDISMEDWNANSLAKSQLVVLSTCLSGGDATTETGSTVDENMAGRMYWLGAHNVVSSFNATTPGYDLAWNSAFMTGVLLGRSLRTAKMRADYHLYDDYFMDITSSIEGVAYGNVNERHDLGDESYVPGFTPDYAFTKESYDYNYLPQLTLSTSIASYTNVVRKKNGNTIIYPKFNLPKDAIKQDNTPCLDNEFDVYMDEHGGIYWYYEGTNILHSYEPYTEDLKIGNGVVDSEEAMALATEFLREMEYNVNGYQVKTSNKHSKNYTIEFFKTKSENNTTKKLVFHMQAKEEEANGVPGEVFITSFSAYVANYDS